VNITQKKTQKPKIKNPQIFSKKQQKRKPEKKTSRNQQKPVKHPQSTCQNPQKHLVSPLREINLHFLSCYYNLMI
jgi:hypothetical protein